MSKRRNLRKTGVLAGVAALAGLAFAGVAQAMPGDHPDYDQYCKADQLDVTITQLDHAMGKTGADVVFTAKPGQSCLLTGAPGLTFKDSAGKPLDIAARTAPTQDQPVRVDQGHQASAAFSYRTVDMNTGQPLTGPTPATVEVALPGPTNAYTVDVPWASHTQVPGPVDVTAVAAR